MDDHVVANDVVVSLMTDEATDVWIMEYVFALLHTVDDEGASISSMAAMLGIPEIRDQGTAPDTLVANGQTYDVVGRALTVVMRDVREDVRARFVKMELFPKSVVKRLTATPAICAM